MTDMAAKVAIITGAASGIGRAAARLFASNDARVVVSDVDQAGLDETVRLIDESGDKVHAVICDVADPRSVESLIAETIEQFKRLDYACNNAGIEGEQAATADCTIENWRRTIDINLTGAWLCMKHEIPQMLETGGGAIVNTSSIAGLIGFGGLPAYVASKHGLNGLTKTAAIEYAQRGIRINAVCPGAIETPMIHRVTHDEMQREDDLIGRHPMGRMGTAKEVAEVMAWLCSDAASFVTGHMLAADGGYVAQ